MPQNKLPFLVQSCWFNGDLEEKFLLYGEINSFRLPHQRLTIIGYWSPFQPHYLLSASYDSAYVKPENIKEDSNLLLTIISRDESLNQRAFSEFSAKTNMRGFHKFKNPQGIAAIFERQREAFLGLEREGLGYLGRV
ncbi:MAG: hypothetical protein AABY00_00060 [Nanoarchaeota archaeon]